MDFLPAPLPESDISAARVTSADTLTGGYSLAESTGTFDQSPSVAQSVGVGNDVTVLAVNRQKVILGIGGYGANP